MRKIGVDYNTLPNNSELAKYKILSHSWKIMQDIELVLGVSHKHLSDDDDNNVSVPTGSAHCPADRVQ